MKPKLFLLFLSFFLLIVISGCAATDSGSGGYERPSGDSGHHH